LLYRSFEFIQVSHQFIQLPIVEFIAGIKHARFESGELSASGALTNSAEGLREVDQGPETVQTGRVDAAMNPTMGSWINWWLT